MANNIDHAVRAHSKFSPSSAKRWMACPGSIALCAKMPKKDSVFAAEGTDAHELAEYCLKNKVAPSQEAYNLAVKKPKMPKDMAAAVEVYVDDILTTVDLIEKPLWDVETKFNLEWLHEGLFGSNDCFIYSPKTKKLWIYDYKHGAGVIVEPDHNPQMMIYAIGAIAHISKLIGAKDMGSCVDIVELVIVQPRAFGSDSGIKRWHTTAKELLFWAWNALKPALVSCGQKDAKLFAGSHCKFCSALAVCPEQIKNACNVAKTDFETLALPDVSMLTPAQIAKILVASEMFSTWAKEVESYAFMQASSGVRIPGYKLVQKRANRSWVDESDAANVLVSALGDEAFDKKLISPAAAEKALKKCKINAEATLDGLVEKKDAGLALATSDDKRAEVFAQKAAVDFLADEDFLQ